MTPLRSRMSRALVVAVAAIATAAAFAPLASAAGGSSKSLTTKYAVGKRYCPARPKAGHATCFAERKVVVKKGTPGARPFQVGDGATGSAFVGPNGGLAPAALAKAYGFNSAATPATPQTVAIVDAFDDPTIASDLTHFSSQYGLAACTTANGCFKKVNQSGNASPLPPKDTGWAGEIALDVETVHAVCQKCKIVLVEATSNSNANLDAAENTAAGSKVNATEITNSFGGPANPPSSADIAAFNHPGIVITASTGDDGWNNFDQWPNGQTPTLADSPAALNTVVAVGGTSLFLTQTGTRQSESVWNDNGTQDYWELNFSQPLGAGGSGCSKTIAAQSWQTNLSYYASTTCGTHRSVGDVSADADYLTGFDTYDTTGNTGWGTIGGTSFASPLVAAMFGLAGGAHGVNYPAQTLYSHLGTASDFYDVTVGGNGFCGGAGASQCTNQWTSPGYNSLDCAFKQDGTASAGTRSCDALKGYDGPTGVGTPVGLNGLKP